MSFASRAMSYEVSVIQEPDVEAVVAVIGVANSCILCTVERDAAAFLSYDSPRRRHYGTKT